MRQRVTKAIVGSTSTREIVLTLLRERQGEWLSGQLLAQKTGLSRAAVWKQIEALRAEGYGIEAVTRRGYRLRYIPDKLFPAEIRYGLETRIFGRGEIHHDERTTSTNDVAKQMAARGAPEGSLAVAEEQTQGRGRLARMWFSPPGAGLYVSIILRPLLLPVHATRIVSLAAVAVAEILIAATGLAVRVKWPNDVLVGGKKIAGILAEAAVEMDAVDYVVIGIGLNVNVPPDSFPAELRPTATSILAAAGRSFSRLHLLRQLLASLESTYNTFCEAGFTPILKRWKSLADMTGRQVSLRTMDGIYRGEVVDFDEDGFMILRDTVGRQRRFYSGDVTLEG